MNGIALRNSLQAEFRSVQSPPFSQPAARALLGLAESELDLSASHNASKVPEYKENKNGGFLTLSF